MGGLRPRAALPGLLRDALLLLTLQTRSESRPSPTAPRGQVLPGQRFWELMGHTRVVLTSLPTASQALQDTGLPRAAPRAEALLLRQSPGRTRR